MYQHSFDVDRPVSVSVIKYIYYLIIAANIIVFILFRVDRYFGLHHRMERAWLGKCIFGSLGLVVILVFSAVSVGVVYLKNFVIFPRKAVIMNI